MHIPDGFLSNGTAAVSGVISAGAIAIALRQTRRHLPPRKVPLMGLAAAFVFAAQMLNFPVAGGTSGHMIGGVLCSVLLGPSAAVLVISSVLIVQCFVFADGGVLALGANIFNMAVVGAVGGYFVYGSVYKMLPDARGRLVAIAFASWLATVVAAVACAGELSVSETVAWSVAFPAMAGVHMLIGVGEAVMTTLVILAILRTRPELMRNKAIASSSSGYAEIVGFGLLIALGLAIFVSPFACPWPDGLDHVAEMLGFKSRAIGGNMVPPLIADYAFPGIKSPAIATAIAGLVGTVVAFLLAFVFARMLIPQQVGPEQTTDAGPSGA